MVFLHDSHYEKTTDHCVAFLGCQFKGGEASVVGEHVQWDSGVQLCISTQKQIHHLAGNSPVWLHDQNVQYGIT